MRQQFKCQFAVISLCLTMGWAIASGTAWAQSYPNRPIQLIVGYAAGGTGDTVARLLAEHLSIALGQPVTVVNRAGASGVIGARSVALAAPDGYTLLVGQTAELVINQHLVRDIGYRPERDLQPVALVEVVPLALVVRADAPYNTVGEMIKTAHASKQGLSFASAGAGTPGRFAAELLRLRTDSRLRHVPYDGAAPALNDLVEGRVDFYFSGFPPAVPYVRSGKLKMLAVSSATRSSSLPDVPTIAESGVKGFDISLWVGVFAPRDTSGEVVSRLNNEINAILQKPDVASGLYAGGAVVTPMSTAQVGTFIKSETKKYADLIRDEFCSTGYLKECDGFAALAW